MMKPSNRTRTSRFAALFCFLAAAVTCVVAQTPPDEGLRWPREMDADGMHVTIYQPQVDQWKQDRLEARAAVTVTRSGGSTPMYGIVSLTARTDVDKESRIVMLENLKVSSVSFPAAKSQESELEHAIRGNLRDWPRTVTLDRLLADMAMTQAEGENESVPVKNDPPKILYSATPAALIMVDGQPVLRALPGTSFQRVINTPATLLYDAAASRYYLDGNSIWMTASTLDGPWTAAPNPPPGLDQAKAQIEETEQKDPHDHSKDPGPPPMTGALPAVFVSTTPAELLVTRGAPAMSPIPRTKLLYVTNTDNNMFLDVSTQGYYVLLSGRWFRAKSFQGPWTWVPGSQLPQDFAKIPPDSPKGAVLASVPGTEQAREAVIANQIPQTAAVRRTEAKFEVRYDGSPQFRVIEGTSMEYAVNTSSDVIHVGASYYGCHNGVWFVGDAPVGPWVVADTIPAEIYQIPPSSPLFHDRYVYVYGSDPDLVYYGYTPGYLGAYVWDGAVVFGTGWYYSPWVGDYWFGWPWTWGFGFGFGYWGGGWFWRPSGGYWWYHNQWYANRIYSGHWNPQWHPGDAERFHYNTNVYNRWQGNSVVSRAARPEGGAGLARGGQTHDIYAGSDGQVWEHRGNSWYRQGNDGSWSKSQPERGLDEQRQSRSLGESRSNEYRSLGSRVEGGMPHTFSGGFGGGRGGGRR
ncbi:MAG: carbohydrate-binding family V/XII [Bryobacteraceae bacterium]